MSVLTITLVFLLIFTSAVCKSIQDKIQFHFEKSVFKNLGDFWNPKESWKRKYKNLDPGQGEWFPGSTTIFVSLTDAWHLFGFIRNFSLILSLALVTGNLLFLFFYPLFTGVFHVFYTYLFKKER